MRQRERGRGGSGRGWPGPSTTITARTVIAVGVRRADRRGFPGVIPRQAPARVHSAREGPLVRQVHPGAPIRGCRAFWGRQGPLNLLSRYLFAT